MNKEQAIHIGLSRPDDLIPCCGSLFFGDPDLPCDFEYPSYIGPDGEMMQYQFICQINLSEVAPLDHSGILPHKGLLSFFAKIDRYLGHEDGGTSIGLSLSEPDDVKVLYFPEVNAAGDDKNKGFLRQVLVDDNDDFLNPAEWQMKFSNVEHLDIDTLLFDGDNSLLAEPYHREWEDWDEPCQGWRILLQIDSSESNDYVLNFVDWGVLVFLISPEDLANARFDRVRAQILSS